MSAWDIMADPAYRQAEEQYLTREPDGPVTCDDDSPLAIARAVERILVAAVDLSAQPAHAPHASGIVWDASATARLGALSWAAPDEAMALLADTAVRLAMTPAQWPMHLVLQEAAWAARDEVRRVEQAEDDWAETEHIRRQYEGPCLRETGEAA